MANTKIIIRAEKTKTRTEKEQRKIKLHKEPRTHVHRRSVTLTGPQVHGYQESLRAGGRR